MPVINQDQHSKNSKRRRLLKSLAAGGGVVAAGKTLPETWVKPVVGSVLLPAHAQVSPVQTSPGAPVTFQVATCQANGNNGACGDGAIGVELSGTVSASDGSDLAGAVLDVNIVFNPATETDSFQVAVVAGNTFSGTNRTFPATLFNSPGDHVITISFNDQATFGTDTCVINVITCGGLYPYIGA